MGSLSAPVVAVLIAVLVIAILAVTAFTLTKLFVRTKKGFAFVKTGFGGERIVMDGGAVILPILHEIVWICMKTRKIIVGRTAKNALITKDKFRVDVEAEFYLRVKQDGEAVATAAQSLGEGAMKDPILKELMEGKFIDALRAVAASMDMNELHEKRADFVQAVQNNVQTELEKNGLELESVSLISLDQTSIEHLDENNAFDAEGMTKLTKIIEDRKKIRNDVEQDNRIQIEQRNLEAEKKSMAIQKEEELSRAEQNKEVAVAQAEREREAKEAKIEAERLVKEAEIAKEKSIKAADIARDKEIESAEIDKQKAIETSEIDKAKAIQQAEIDKQKTVEMDVQQKNIEVFEKSQEESIAQTEANEKRAEAVAAEERIATAQETEIATRTKSIAIIEAEREAEELAVGIKVAAEADKDAAGHKAEAVKVAAAAEADAIVMAANANKETLLAEAAGTEAINAAQNMLSPDIQRMTITLETIRNSAPIIEAMMKPVEKIDSIKSINVTGLTGNGGGGMAPAGPTGNGGSGNFVGDLFSGLMNYKATMPFIEDIMKEAGIDATSPAALVEGLKPMMKEDFVGVTVDEDEIHDVVDVPAAKVIAPSTLEEALDETFQVVEDDDKPVDIG